MHIRLMFQKLDTARFLSHLEMQQMWQRSLRRAKVPLAMSKGFNPHPKISFGSALPVGVASLAEYLDVELRENIELTGLKEKINACLPIGFKVIKIAEIPPKSKPLMAIINRAEYTIEQRVKVCSDDIATITDKFLGQEVITIERETKSGTKLKDIRSGIFSLKAQCAKSELIITTLVQTGSQGNVRPGEVLNTFLGFANLEPIGLEKITRNGLFVNVNGKTVTPLEVLEG